MEDLQRKLKEYVDRFQAVDEECYRQAIPNDEAYTWLKDEIPFLECPDEVLEETYYFRWWTFRKHWKATPAGHIITEFLPSVPWAGPYNSINCACCHHIREGRWLADPKGWLKEYIRFWLTQKGDAFSYSMWLASTVEDYCCLRSDQRFEQECLEYLVRLYHGWEQKALEPCGLFWSDDDRDGMEYSISGPGLRPTLNSYLYGDAMAISRMAKRAGDLTLSEQFRHKAEAIRCAMDRLLWDGDFYRTLPCRKGAALPDTHRPPVKPAHRVRELIGYLPWYFAMPEAGKESAFSQLMDPRGFLAPWGLTTAEQRHPRFNDAYPHECLWNGPVWPFATSQTLTAAAALLRHYPATDAFTKEDYWVLLRQYALSHCLRDEHGHERPWIDEDMDPYTGNWIARSQLMADHWNPKRGGYERGKDYNHSTFCDLVLGGLLGIDTDENGRLTVHPLIPASWSYFRVTGIFTGGKRWIVQFDRDGLHYGKGAGIQIFPQGEIDT